MQLVANKATWADGCFCIPGQPVDDHRPGPSHQKEWCKETKVLFASYCPAGSFYLPTEVTVVPLDGEICSSLGSIKGVKEEEDLCFWSVLLADWVCNVNFNFINTNDIKKMNIKHFNPVLYCNAPQCKSPSLWHHPPKMLSRTLLHVHDTPACAWHSPVQAAEPEPLKELHLFSEILFI